MAGRARRRRRVRSLRLCIGCLGRLERCSVRLTLVGRLPLVLVRTLLAVPRLPLRVRLLRVLRLPRILALLAVRQLLLLVGLLRLAMAPGVAGLRPIWRLLRGGRRLIIGCLVPVWLLLRILRLALSRMRILPAERIPGRLLIGHASFPRAASGAALVPLVKTRQRCRKCADGAESTRSCDRAVSGRVRLPLRRGA